MSSKIKLRSTGMQKRELSINAFLWLGTLQRLIGSIHFMNKLRIRSVLIVSGVVVGIVLGVSGSNFYRANHPRVLKPMVYKPPSLQQLLGGTSDVATVGVSVDSEGRVEDYRVLPDAHGTRSVSHQIKNMLILPNLRPA